MNEVKEHILGRVKNYKALHKVGVANSESVVRLSECESILEFINEHENK